MTATDAFAFSNFAAGRLASRRRFIAGGLLFAVAGCSAPGEDMAPLSDYHPQAYRLGGGDQIRVIVYGEDELTGVYRVDDQGRVALPLLGGVIATNLTAQQLEDHISSELRSRNILHDASVSVEVVAYRPIFVLGEVAKPGQYPYQPGMTLLTAVAVAGGFTYRAVQDRASVVRTVNGSSPRAGIVTPLSYVAPGDVITVFERRF
jgi:polysaccharide biosynthesis/export protein